MPQRQLYGELRPKTGTNRRGRAAIAGAASLSKLRLRRCQVCWVRDLIRMIAVPPAPDAADRAPSACLPSSDSFKKALFCPELY